MPDKMYRVIVSARVAQMMVSRAAFLARIDPDAAERLTKEFRETAAGLDQMPYRGPWLEGEFIPHNYTESMLLNDRLPAACRRRKRVYRRLFSDYYLYEYGYGYGSGRPGSCGRSVIYENRPPAQPEGPVSLFLFFLPWPEAEHTILFTLSWPLCAQIPRAEYAPDGQVR